MLSQELKDAFKRHVDIGLPMGMKPIPDVPKTISMSSEEMLTRVLHGDLIPVARSTFVRIIETLEKAGL